MNRVSTGGLATVYLVDDDAAVLRALARLLRVFGYSTMSFESAAEFLAHAPGSGLGCAVIDLCMPGMGGLEVQAELIRMGVKLPVIFLTAQGDIPSTVQAVKRGAIDYLAKPVDSDTLLPAIRTAVEEHQRLRADAAELQALHRRYETLTPREKEVCLGVATGSLNKQIAGNLNISDRTVKVHRARVMRKLGAGSVADLVRLVDRLRLPSDPRS